MCDDIEKNENMKINTCHKSDRKMNLFIKKNPFASNIPWFEESLIKFQSTLTMLFYRDNLLQAKIETDTCCSCKQFPSHTTSCFKDNVRFN